MPAQGIGGVAATDEFVAVSSRDTSDKSDLFEVLDADDALRYSFDFVDDLRTWRF